jgi:hydroxymethylbilane synthase
VSNRIITAGSRASKLALLQTQLVLRQLGDCHPHLQFHSRQIRTQGDRDRTTPLAQLGGQGVFVKELEGALLDGYIDMAVHSLKDVPTDLRPGLKLAAVGMRTDARDALVSKSGKSLSDLPRGACIGTGSERRALQLRAFRSDLRVCPLRGNLDTRLRKLHSGEFDAIIVAAAAMLRMGWQERITEYLPLEVFLPSAGQGALSIEIRSSDHELEALVAPLNDEATWRTIRAERAFLSALGGGCQAPVAVLGTVSSDALHLEGMAAIGNANAMLRAAEDGSSAEPEEVGTMLAQKLLALAAIESVVDRGK